MIWLLDDKAVGFSSCHKIVFGERANMHLHVAEPQRRHQGIGTECVRRSVEIYFQKLRLKSLFCEPNAFQRRSEPNASEGRFQIPQDPHDRSWAAELLSGCDGVSVSVIRLNLYFFFNSSGRVICCAKVATSCLYVEPDRWWLSQVAERTPQPVAETMVAASQQLSRYERYSLNATLGQVGAGGRVIEPRAHQRSHPTLAMSREPFHQQHRQFFVAKQWKLSAVVRQTVLSFILHFRGERRVR
jgi:Acetyltransferase (GNAT) family